MHHDPFEYVFSREIAIKQTVRPNPFLRKQVYEKFNFNPSSSIPGFGNNSEQYTNHNESCQISFHKI